ncbi:response regulator transcription factor [Sphingopyxis kveilinensis]|uniref:response regulator transcription factor n=1 Tax=Sphingopyxis kveilinensis TaxID=3114367 RepID=UPI0030CB1F5B
MPTITLADDHRILLEPMRVLIERDTDLRVVSMVANGTDAMAAIERLRPDIALLDLAMPAPGGLQILRSLHRSSNDQVKTKIVFLTASISQAEVAQAVTLGVAGIMLKESVPEELIQCLSAVLRGERWLPSQLVGSELSATMDRYARARLDLTAREREIAQGVAGGLSNRRIADQLGISEGTVKIHLHNIFGKLQIQSRSQLAFCVSADVEAAARIS